MHGRTDDDGKIEVHVVNDPPDLEALGYSEHWAGLFEPYASSGCVPGRVLRSDRGSVLVASPRSIARAKPSARLVEGCGRSGGASRRWAIGWPHVSMTTSMWR